MNEEELWLKLVSHGLSEGEATDHVLRYRRALDEQKYGAERAGDVPPADLGQVAAARIGAGEGLAGTGGAVAGAEGGAALGALTGPLAPVAVPVGGVVGGIAGYMAGKKALQAAMPLIQGIPRSAVNTQWDATTSAHSGTEMAGEVATGAVLPGIAASMSPRVLRLLSRLVPGGIGERLAARATIQELTPAAKIAALQKEIQGSRNAIDQGTYMAQDATYAANAEARATQKATEDAAIRAERTRILKQQADELARKAANPERGPTSLAKHKTIQTQAEIAAQDLRIKKAMADAAEGVGQGPSNTQVAELANRLGITFQAAKRQLESGAASLTGLLGAGATAGVGLLTAGRMAKKPTQFPDPGNIGPQPTPNMDWTHYPLTVEQRIAMAKGERIPGKPLPGLLLLDYVLSQRR